jgi:hypothetical protein
MPKDCTVCLVDHDEEIHAATTRVHVWFRNQVTRDLHHAAVDPMANDDPMTNDDRMTNQGDELCDDVDFPAVTTVPA